MLTPINKLFNRSITLDMEKKGVENVLQEGKDSHGSEPQVNILHLNNRIENYEMKLHS